MSSQLQSKNSSSSSTKKSKPIAVVISDVHYSLKTLEVADAAMRLAIAKANELDVPFIVAGDLHDTKANMRGECVNAMIQTFKLVNTKAWILVGNHDKINEKSEEHSLTFLEPYATLVNRFRYPKSHTTMSSIFLIGYHHDPQELIAHLRNIPSKSTLIMHQGIKNADGGDYIQDHSAITVDDVAGHRVISGHYHNRQTIALPDGGQWDYVGNPYTLTFGEAKDPAKGFQVLYDDGSLEFIPTNLRRHVKIEQRVGEVNTSEHYNVGDLVWLKLTGEAKHLDNIDKAVLGKIYNIPGDYRLELQPLDVLLEAPSKSTRSNSEALDDIIDSATNTSDDQKARVKALWRELQAKESK
jgi:DNA repair exonuclease SbcCD nuclease subunit